MIEYPLNPFHSLKVPAPICGLRFFFLSFQAFRWAAALSALDISQARRFFLTLRANFSLWISDYIEE